MQASGWKKQLPNIITVSRIFAVPIIIVLMLWDDRLGGYWSALVFVLASLTDYFDGKYARQFNVVSNFGKFMDPIADKILVTSTLIMMIPSGRLGAVMVIIILSRDTLISGLRSIAATENMIISAGAMGKWKTAIQMVAIPAVLVREPFWGIPLYEIGYWTLWASVALSVVSGAEYVIKYARGSQAS
jgi:CDP-diacylglycerol--glycerol-3-phosphate 3-phosphatidyltransferase